MKWHIVTDLLLLAALLTLITLKVWEMARFTDDPTYFDNPTEQDA
jgi:predicted small integral membrane protein